MIKHTAAQTASAGCLCGSDGLLHSVNGKMLVEWQQLVGMNVDIIYFHL